MPLICHAGLASSSDLSHSTRSHQHTRLGPASLVLYNVSTLYFETDRGDGFREPGFSKERRLEPQITISPPPRTASRSPRTS
jgi:hypothetical protein